MRIPIGDGEEFAAGEQGRRDAPGANQRSDADELCQQGTKLSPVAAVMIFRQARTCRLSQRDHHRKSDHHQVADAREDSQFALSLVMFREIPGNAAVQGGQHRRDAKRQR